MARKKVEICGVNTSSLPLLSEEETEDLFERIEQGDLLAREHYIKGNLRLVLSIIQRFSGSNENADDLFQVGCIGLMKAIDNFDRNLNVKFSTYAVPMIIGEVKRYLRDNHSMRVSRSLRDTAYKAINAREVLTKKLNHEPTIDVIAKEIDMKKEDVLFALDAIATPLSLYEPVYQDGGDTLYLMDQVKDKKNKEDSWVESIALKEAMEHLPDREYDIIKMRFFEGKNTNRSCRRNRHFPGTSQPSGKKRPKTHEEPLSVILQYLIVYVSSSKYTPRSNRRSKKKSRLLQTHMLSSQTAFQHH